MKELFFKLFIDWWLPKNTMHEETPDE